jgi:hypothetical protein
MPIRTFRFLRIGVPVDKFKEWEKGEDYATIIRCLYSVRSQILQL